MTHKTTFKQWAFALTFCLAAQFSWAQVYEWTQTAGGSSDEGAKDAITDPDGNVVVIGFFTGTVDFDPGPGVFNMTAAAPAIGNTDLFIQKLDLSGNFIWAKQLVSNRFDSKLITGTDLFGNILIAGGFRQVTDFDPGSGVTNLIAQGQTDMFLLQLDVDGNFVWVKQWGGLLSENMSDMKLAPSGNIYLTGTFNSSVDFDPSPTSTQEVNPYNTNYSFVLKLDGTGNYAWVKTIGAIGQDNYVAGIAVALDADENVFTTGHFNDQFDFDPGPGTSNMFSPWATVYVQKLDKNGNFLWAKSIQGSLWNYPYDIAVDKQGSVYTVGSITETVDMDPGPGTSSITSKGAGDAFVQKLDADGNLVWAKSIGGTGGEVFDNIVVNEQLEVLLTGSFNDTVDFDPGPLVYNLTGANFQNAFLEKLSPSGDFVSAKVIPYFFNNIRRDQTGNFLFAGGFSGTVDFDQGPGQDTHASKGLADIFVTKWSENPQWNYYGTVFRDFNANQIQEAGEPGIDGVLVRLKGQQRYVSTDASGVYHFYTDIHDKVITVASSRPYWTVSPLEAVADPAQTPRNFAVAMPPNAEDLAISLVEVQPFRPGFETEIVLQVTNIGAVDLDSIPVRLKVQIEPEPDTLQFVSSEPPPITQTYNLLNWWVPTLPLDHSETFRLRFLTPASAVIGTPLEISTSVFKLNDLDNSNNKALIQTKIVGAFDPNEKQVSPETATVAELDTTRLKYVIRFQNTGNYPATYVMIRDTLPPALNLSTLRILGGSHDYTWRLLGDRVLEFRFANIQLPDSTSNEPESHGFIAFSIQPDKNLLPGAEIVNRAGIYFDFNTPVITAPSVFIVGTVAVQEPESTWMELKISPNPAPAFSPLTIGWPESGAAETVVALYNTAGGLVWQTKTPKGERRTVIPGLPPGDYFVQVRAGGRTGGKVLVVK